MIVAAMAFGTNGIHTIDLLATCFGKSSGTPLLEFEKEHTTREQGRQSQAKYGKPRYPYECPNCGKWHLTPHAPYSAPTASPKSTTFQSSHGQGHAQYATQHEARRAANFVCTLLSTDMVPYQCLKCRQYWHLSPANRQTKSRP